MRACPGPRHRRLCVAREAALLGMPRFRGWGSHTSRWMSIDAGLALHKPAHCIVAGGDLARSMVQGLVRAQGSRRHCTCVAQLGQGGGDCWPDPHAQVVILYNGTNHFCGLYRREWGGKPANESPMGMGTCRALRAWLSFHGVRIWPPTPHGFCGAESVAMSRMLLPGWEQPGE